MNFILAPASTHDLRVGNELLTQHTDLDVYGDKACISARLAARLAQDNRIHLNTIPSQNQKV
jgi:hypothetical protein